jgi:putative transcriptional regulator
MIRIHLSRILGEKKMTRKKLAEITGIRPTTVSEYYHELVDRVNLKHLSAMCCVLECRIEELLEYIPDPGILHRSDHE